MRLACQWCWFYVHRRWVFDLAFVRSIGWHLARWRPPDQSRRAGLGSCASLPPVVSLRLLRAVSSKLTHGRVMRADRDSTPERDLSGEERRDPVVTEEAGS
jgi:hypothetical protein